MFAVTYVPLGVRTLPIAETATKERGVLSYVRLIRIVSRCRTFRRNLPPSPPPRRRAKHHVTPYSPTSRPPRDAQVYGLSFHSISPSFQVHVQVPDHRVPYFQVSPRRTPTDHLQTGHLQAL